MVCKVSANQFPKKGRQLNASRIRMSRIRPVCVRVGVCVCGAKTKTKVAAGRQEGLEPGQAGIQAARQEQKIC